MSIALALGLIACGSSATTNLTGPTASKCQISIGSVPGNFGASGGSGNVSVSAARECTWSATSSGSWLQITSARDGQGDGTITFKVDANPDPVSRRGSISIGDVQAGVAQDAAACAYSTSDPPPSLGASGGETPIDVRTHPACAWTAAANATWISVNPRSGQGPGTLTITIAPNIGPERTAMLTIGSDQVILHQLSAPPAPPAPAPTPSPTPAPTPTPTPTPTPAPTPTPSPGPTPPPPPSPTPNPPPDDSVEVSGRVDHLQGVCPFLSFDLGKHRDVRTFWSTDFQGGTCRDIRNKSQVTVRGTQKDGVIVADVVVLEKR